MRRSLVLITCIIFALYYYLTIVQIPCGEECFERAQMIVDGTEQAPFAYRLLAPALLVALGNTLQVHVIFYAVGLALFFILLDAWLARLRVQPMVMFAVVMVLPVMFQAWWLASYTLVEWIFILCALHLLTPRSSSLVHSIEK